MTLTPLDIHHKEFKTARFGGYNEEEVDSFLDQIADELEKLIQDNTDLRQQIEHLNKRLAEFEEMQTSLQSALLAATKSAEAVKEQAKQESEALRVKAQEEAESLVKSAQEQARQMILRAQSERQKLERSFEKLKQVKTDYLESLRKLASSQLQRVEEVEQEDASGSGLEEVSFKTELEIPEVKPSPAPQEPQEPEADDSAEQKVQQEIPEASESPSTAAPREMPTVNPQEPPERKVDQKTQAKPAESDVYPPPESSNTVVSREEARQSRGAGIASDTVSVSTQESTRQSSPVKTDTREKGVPSSNLVDEVLSLDEDSDIFRDLEELEEQDQGKKRGRRGRKEKKDKHFFWE